MAELYGWAGSILVVDLDNGRIEREALSPVFARKYLGTNGFNAAKLFELVKPGIDALGPKNVIMFGVGPFAGTRVAGAGRVTVTAKSPLTNTIGHSSLGGFFGNELKAAGYDQIIISGKAEHPVYLLIHEDEVNLKSASHLWGKTSFEADKMIKEEVGEPHIPVLSIGQAGENLVRFACVRHGLATAGRTGMGAVMGSKNLKAIAAKGSRRVAIAKPAEFIKTCKWLSKNAIAGLVSLNKFMHEMGTPGIVDSMFIPSSPAEGSAGIMMNYRTSVFPNWEKISGATLKKNFAGVMKTCPNCPIACKVSHTVNSGEFAGTQGESVEFGTLGSVGLGCGIDNLPALLRINELCQAYGVDGASVAYMMVWAMDCYEKGILTEADFDGSPFRWGDYKAVIEMIHKIANRQGFGNILAEGEKRAPKIVGRGSERLLHHCKGLSFMPEDPRPFKAGGLQHCTAPRGADHLSADFIRMVPVLMTTEVGKKLVKDPEAMDPRAHKSKGWVVKWCEDITAFINALGICIRPASAVSFEDLRQVISSAVGIDFSETESLKIGERIFNVMKAFNSREGLTRKDDYPSIPDKFAKEPVADGRFKGEVLNLDALLDEYYRARGWDTQTGLQTREKLGKLELSHIAEELEKTGAVVDNVS